MNENELKKILDEHKLWLEGMGGQRADLSWADLRGADLRGVDISEANRIGANLSWANLSGANLRWADLHGADLRGADLYGADLRVANLSGANLDYSCWPLWCGSKNVKVDLKIAQQIAAHFCALDCDEKEYKSARKAILKFAQKSHRAKHLEIKK